MLLVSNVYFIILAAQPRVRVNPSKLEASRGSDAMFHCDLLGSPLPTLAQWKRGGTNSDLGKANPLVINNIQFSDQGMYICEADSGGSTLSNSGMLVISGKLFYWEVQICYVTKELFRQKSHWLQFNQLVWQLFWAIIQLTSNFSLIRLYGIIHLLALTYFWICGRCDAVGGIPVSLVWVKDGKKLTGETRKQ